MRHALDRRLDPWPPPLAHGKVPALEEDRHAPGEDRSGMPVAPVGLAERGREGAGEGLEAGLLLWRGADEGAVEGEVAGDDAPVEVRAIASEAVEVIGLSGSTPETDVTFERRAVELAPRSPAIAAE